MKNNEARDLKSKIEWCLKNIPETRNSDIDLTREIWRRFYPQKIKSLDGIREYVDLIDLFELPREDAIKRIRATIQNEEKKFPPTSWEVARQRKWNEAEWGNLLGYGTMAGGVGSPIGSPVKPEAVPVPRENENSEMVVDPRQGKML